MRETIAASVILLSLGSGVGSAAAQSGLMDATKKAGQVTKDSGKAVGDTTKKAVETVGKETKKGATATKNAVTGQARATCVDGTRQTRKTQKVADAGCAKRGGVAK